VALWNPVDIGYGAIYISKAQLDGTLKPESGFVEAGRLGKLKFIAKDVVLLGDPVIFNSSNIDNFKL
jgi:rhamnose transport system substrate-binding protein